ncbi:MAG: hypothetical protein JRE16_05410 [Deltaproteobacteria bacterium]|jgi:hypothetical protein|nr:hypothetical protein [Deltaproteobacteria bacterium]MBW2503990.1 hypothetical protein [Deltaproteobacteria bacterium]
MKHAKESCGSDNFSSAQSRAIVLTGMRPTAQKFVENGLFYSQLALTTQLAQSFSSFQPTLT